MQQGDQQYCGGVSYSIVRQKVQEPLLQYQMLLPPSAAAASPGRLNIL
jgi:hypothetical protein